MTEAIQKPHGDIMWELEHACPCGSGKLIKDCCDRD